MSLYGNRRGELCNPNLSMHGDSRCDGDMMDIQRRYFEERRGALEGC